jgi:hypothetical protein
MSANPRTAFVGTWRLVHSVEFGPGGDPSNHGESFKTPIL